MIDHQTLGEAKQVCPTTTQRLVREGALLVDVRERTEVASLAFDVPAIVNIPLFEMEQRWGELPEGSRARAGLREWRAQPQGHVLPAVPGFHSREQHGGGAAQVDAQGLRGHRPALRGTCSYGHFFVLWR